LEENIDHLITTQNHDKEKSTKNLTSYFFSAISDFDNLKVSQILSNPIKKVTL